MYIYIEIQAGHFNLTTNALFFPTRSKLSPSLKSATATLQCGSMTALPAQTKPPPDYRLMWRAALCISELRNTFHKAFCFSLWWDSASSQNNFRNRNWELNAGQFERNNLKTYELKGRIVLLWLTWLSSTRSLQPWSIWACASACNTASRPCTISITPGWSIKHWQIYRQLFKRLQHPE